MIALRTKKDYENKMLQELIIERQELVKELIKIETEIFNTSSTKKELNSFMLQDPSPELIWSVLNSNLLTITELIKDKSINIK